MRLKMMTGGVRIWGIYDDFEGIWYDGGDHPDAVYYAGVPTWRRERDAQAVLDGLLA